MVSPTAQTEKQQGIATYAQPYVESMLGATMQNLFNVDPSTGQVLGLKEYNPYSYRPEDYVAGMTPLQQQAMQGIAGLQVPGYTANAANAAQSALGRLAATQYSPTSANMREVNAQNASAAQLGAAPTINAAQFQGPSGIGYDRVASRDITAPEMVAEQTNYAPTLQQYQMDPYERVSAPGSITVGGALDAYMSPYMQSVVDVQQRDAKRQAAIAQQLLGAQAARSGAFGGSGAALQRAQANAQLQRDLQGIQATGSQAAFQNAQTQFNTEQQARMQAALANQQAGLATNTQNLASKLATQQLGTQTGLQTALANLTARQQAAVQNQATKLQASGMNATQALQAALANQQAGMQTGQFNAQQQYNTALQNAQLQQQASMANQSLAGQYGLAQGQLNQGANLANAQNALQASMANQQAQQAANALAAQQQQFGANLGLQANQAALSGAATLGNLGTTQLQNQLSVLNAQNQAGSQQQALNQKAIDTAVQNYNTAQQYPYMQLGFMQNMLGGLPIGTTSEQTYQAAPSLSSQLLGAGTALIGANQMLGGSGGLGGLLNAGASGIGGLLGSIGSGISSAVSGIGDALGLAEGGMTQKNAPPPKKNKAPMGLQALALSKM